MNACQTSDAFVLMKNWMPVKTVKSPGYPLVQWMNFMDIRFVEPFFDETIQRCKAGTQNSRRYKSVSAMDMMLPWSENLPWQEPDALIFHVSRSGSTMLSQVLSLDEEHHVLAEVPFLDEMLRLPFTTTDTSEEATRFFHAAYKFYTTNREKKSKRIFIKTDSWHLLFYEQLRSIFSFDSFYYYLPRSA